MQNAGQADPCAQVPGIGGDGERGLGGSLKQDAIDHPLVLIGNVGDLRWQGEDQMVVGHGQQLGLASFQPLLGHRPLTLGAMAVAARVISDVSMAAVLAGRDMAAQCRRTAGLDGTHHLELVEAQMTGPGLPEGGTMAAEDIRDLQSLPGHDGLDQAGGNGLGLS
jgi:hypothetical protein